MSIHIDFVEAVTRYADLEGWWKFEDNLNDSSGNDRTGAHSGTNKYENLGLSRKIWKWIVFGRFWVSIFRLPDIKESRVVLHEPWQLGLKLIKGMLLFLIGVIMQPVRNGHFVSQADNGVSGAHRIEMNGGSIVGDVAVE